jgi:two-component system response regulator RegA
VVDDDEPFRTRLCRASQLRGWAAVGADGGDAALEAVRQAEPNLAIVDLRLANESGLEIVRRLRAADGALAIVMLTGYGSIATALEAVKCGADHYLCKPLDVDQILAAWRTLRAGPKESPPPPPAWRAWNGNTSSAYSPIAAAISRKRPSCWECTGARSSAS